MPAIIFHIHSMTTTPTPLDDYLDEEEIRLLLAQFADSHLAEGGNDEDYEWLAMIPDIDIPPEAATEKGLQGFDYIEDPIEDPTQYPGEANQKYSTDANLDIPVPVSVPVNLPVNVRVPGCPAEDEDNGLPTRAIDNENLLPADPRAPATERDYALAQEWAEGLDTHFLPPNEDLDDDDDANDDNNHDNVVDDDEKGDEVSELGSITIQPAGTEISSTMAEELDRLRAEVNFLRSRTPMALYRTDLISDDSVSVHTVGTTSIV